MAVITITKENFEAEVLKSAQPVLLDFWAAWCGPCRMLSPIVDEVAEERTDVKVGKVNVDEQPDLAAQFGVMSIPTLLVFKNGKLVNQTVGARPKSGVLELHLRDDATTFNPFALDTSRASRDEDFDMDGMGVLVIKKRAKEFFYRRYQGFNTLIIKI